MQFISPWESHRLSNSAHPGITLTLTLLLTLTLTLTVKDCSTPCNGNASESCGGAWRMRGYEVKCGEVPEGSNVETLAAFATTAPGGDKSYPNPNPTSSQPGGDTNAISVFLSTWDMRDHASNANVTQQARVVLSRGRVSSARLHRVDGVNANPRAAWEAKHPDPDQKS